MSRKPKARKKNRGNRFRGSRSELLIASMVLAAAALAAGAWYLTGHTRAVRSSTEHPDVILVTIDTLRADALGYAGNRRAKTPFLDRIAAEAVVFTNAFAHNVVTLPSHANILTGLLPFQHGIRENSGFRLDQKHKTLAHYLGAAGYSTGAFVGAYPLDARYGLNRGFDVYDDRYREGSAPLDFEMQERPAGEVLSAAGKWYQANEGKKRFLWIHLYDPHAPYRPTGSFAEQYRDNPYLGEVAATDAALGAFLEPILQGHPNTLLVITSDHGEGLGDHQEKTHGLFAYQATLKVPLLIHDGGNLRHRVEDQFVSHIDIVPTILERVGVKGPSLPGRSLASSIESRDIYFESLSAYLNRGWAPLVGIIYQGHKYIELPIPELYDLASDPDERRNLVAEQRRLVSSARSQLAGMAPLHEADKGRAVSQEESDKLLSLGYVAGVAAKRSYTAEDDPKNLVHLDQKLQTVVELYQTGNVEGATKLARELVKEREMAVAREMLAFLLQQSEQPESAIESLEKSVREGTATELMRMRLGLILSENGRAREALAILAPFAGRDDPDILNAYGVALADSGDLGQAVPQFEKALRIDPTNAKAYQNLGVVALRANQPERALVYLQKALELNDRLPLALNTLGVVFARTGQPDRAMASWSRAVELEPRLFDALFNLGVVAAQRGQWEISRKALEQFVRSAPAARYQRDLVSARQMLVELKRRSS